MFKNFKGFKITWDDAWQTLGYAAVIVVGLFILASASARHTVDSYYLGRTNTGYCVYASVDFDTDDAVFCSDDIGKAVIVADGANHTLRAH